MTRANLTLPLAVLYAWTTLGAGSQQSPILQGQKYSRTSSTEPISGVALVTWVTKPGQPDELDLAVIWRGRPGWFIGGQGHSESSGGTPTSFQQTITRGDTHVSFQFVFPTRQLTILDGRPIDLEDANVVLVDNVTDAGKTAVAAKLTIPSKLTAAGRLTELFGKSSEIFAFLQCEAEVPQVTARPIIEALCRDLRAANKRK